MAQGIEAGKLERHFSGDLGCISFTPSSADQGLAPIGSMAPPLMGS